jgi:hypothetical protein
VDIQELKRRLVARSRQIGPALAVTVLAGTAGYYSLGLSGAASYVVHGEAESGTVSGNATAEAATTTVTLADRDGLFLVKI